MERKLYRSREDRMLFGVCGGIGEYANIDPTIIRLGMVLIGFTFVGFIFYIAAGLIIPEAPVMEQGRTDQNGRNNYGPGPVRREEDSFDPVAGAKPEMPTKSETENETVSETKKETQTENKEANTAEQSDAVTREV
ncbi:PspC domain-containing protein [Acidaminobacter hydrogenoformans]|uniref:Phage shock protein C (PspC) family protein n=1 Tax=Acidaminobacter hydrogenoformans DSM 2784 TaxID=1120920 RepID=A0A1G5RUS9_9FIRM|nr:PspC domain-containing protein [Acidaminobacter hydrogenoformans]SCZ77628.1 phage shock protein C (PspC) family protein [Acidaminobacter hydrogenoformans DSM 2784]